jgi:hypothetical protein
VPKLEIERGVLMLMTKTLRASFSYLSVIRPWQNNLLGARDVRQLEITSPLFKFEVQNAIG